MRIPSDAEGDIEQIRNKVINQILIIMCLLGSIIVILSFLGVLLFGPRPTTLIHVIGFLVVFFLTLYRYRLGVMFKLTGLLAVLGFDVLYSVYYTGYISSAKVVLVVLPVFVAFICTTRKTLIFLGVLIVSYLMFGYFYVNGMMTPDLDIVMFSQSAFAWVMDAAIIIFSAVGVMYVGRTYNNELIKSNQLIKDQTAEILNREKKYEILYQSSNDAILLVKGRHIVDCNQKALELFGFDREEMVEKSPADISPPFQPGGLLSSKMAEEVFKKAYRGEEQVFEWVHQKRGGEIFTAVISLKLVSLGDDDRYVQSVIRDITRQKKTEKELLAHQEHLEQLVVERTLKLEQTNQQLSSANRELQEAMDQLRIAQAQLVESEKLASVGILTAGIGHEINNPLNFILGGLYKLKDTFANPEEYLEDGDLEESRVETIEIIDEGVGRIRDIVKSLNHFNRANSEQVGPCDIHVIIDNCLRILNHELSGQRVVKEYSDKQVVVYGNDGKLHQIFLNLIHNANQAIDGRGDIAIKTVVSADAQCAVIEIIDSGVGISEEHLTKVFDPFFTTKPPGEGVGLGLFIVYQVVKEHNGSIVIEPVDVGTRVIIELPLALCGG